MKDVRAIAPIVPIVSTVPDSAPKAKALNLLHSTCLSGIDIIVHSGKFCIAIPIAEAKTAEIDIAVSQLPFFLEYCEVRLLKAF